jgi:transaldolase
MPEKTLLAFGDHGNVTGTLPRDGGDSARTLADFRKAGIDLDKLAADLQSQGATVFDESWSKLLDAIKAKGKVLQGVAKTAH